MSVLSISSAASQLQFILFLSASKTHQIKHQAVRGSGIIAKVRNFIQRSWCRVEQLEFPAVDKKPSPQR